MACLSWGWGGGGPWTHGGGQGMGWSGRLHSRTVVSGCSLDMVRDCGNICMWPTWPRIHSLKGLKMNQPASIRAFGIEVKTAQDVGTVFALADGATVAVSDFYVSLIGNNPTFAAWESARLAWREGYAVQRPDVKAESINRAWSRFASDLPVTKPKADNAKAQKVAAARVDPFKGKPVEEIKAAREALGAKIAAGDVSKETAKEYRQAVDAEISARKAAEKSAEKARADATKERREKITETMKALSGEGLALIEAVLDLMSGDSARMHQGLSVLEASEPFKVLKADKPAKASKAK